MLELLKKATFFIITAAVVIIFILLTTNEDADYVSTDLHAVPQNDNPQEEQPSQSPPTNYAVVDVKGAVMNNGIYEVSIDARVNDVIILAGGFKENADSSQVNLAQKVHDEMVIHVPVLGEIAESSADALSNNKVKINYATQEEIETLPGIGPSKALAIIQHREEYGHYQKTEDLLQVSGIGEKTLENMKESIQIP
ncbi:helix-hairpin-helix domain-containing protein [Oceanobacillus damuensis]|uniref:helix-hairpin-helix domain-containing protein n=1 Tax=Oceanobacillus damuensis TaxID=937928 RepID=UPI000835EAF2|nr:helix-hairpin-helix domain-containing protein [Oceanobacillus damuensis]